MKTSAFSRSRRVRGIALAVLAAAVSLLALAALYAPLARHHGAPAAEDGRLAAANCGNFHLYPLDFVM